MSCITGLKRGEGSQLRLNYTGLDTYTEPYTGPKGDSDRLIPALGSSHYRHRELYLSEATITEGKAFDSVVLVYKGFHPKSSANGVGGKRKAPTGGAGSSLIEQPIATHPDYKTVFGAGPSPNAYGRITDESGMFKHFGPLPDGLDGRPAPAAAVGADKLIGVESFVDAGAASFRYSLTTEKQWAPTGQMGRIVTIHSKTIAVPALTGGRNWMLMSVDEESLVVAPGKTFHKTTLNFQSSGEGGWNPLIYKEGGDITLE